VFLLLERATVEMIGASDITLRALPIACGFLGVILLAVLARRILQPPFALVCTALLAFSPWAVVYAKELKQYSVDVFSTCLILLLVWAYIEHRERRRYLIIRRIHGHDSAFVQRSSLFRWLCW
jgi:predicted membrane-bound mannosyltransferase